jgi:apolipoprotein D and lipocalin family protein
MRVSHVNTTEPKLDFGYVRQFISIYLLYGAGDEAMQMQRKTIHRIFGLFMFATLMSSNVWAAPLATVDQVALDEYLGVWHEIARKPNIAQKQCYRASTVTYTLNEYGNVLIQNRCETKHGTLIQSSNEAFIQNAPFNSKFKISFLPEGIRWLPLGRGDYWILKLDKVGGVVLIGEPKRHHLWLLSRDANLDAKVIKEYLDYAQALGFDLSDLYYNK